MVEMNHNLKDKGEYEEEKGKAEENERKDGIKVDVIIFIKHFP